MPGEKLHEAMITEADARTTLDIGDRYIVEPPFSFWNRPDIGIPGEKLPEDFSYTSDNNPEWIETAEVQQAMDLSCI